MSKRIQAVLKDLKDAGASDDLLAKAEHSLGRNTPEDVYTKAVWFLGLATIILVGGAVASMFCKVTTTDALWTAVGAGLGGLAGILSGKNSA